MKAAFAFGLALCVAGATQAQSVWDGRDLARGETLYAEHCAVCHGANLEGAEDWRVQLPDGSFPAPPHDASGHTWHHDTPFLIAYTAFGGQAVLEARGITGVPSGMPGFADVMSEVEILDTLAFIRSTWPAEVREYQDEITAQVE